MRVVVSTSCPIKKKALCYNHQKTMIVVSAVFSPPAGHGVASRLPSPCRLRSGLPCARPERRGGRNKVGCRGGCLQHK